MILEFKSWSEGTKYASTEVIFKSGGTTVSEEFTNDELLGIARELIEEALRRVQRYEEIDRLIEASIITESQVKEWYKDNSEEE